MRDDCNCQEEGAGCWEVVSVNNAEIESGQADMNHLARAHSDMEGNLAKTLEQHFVPSTIGTMVELGRAADIVPDPTVDSVKGKQATPSEDTDCQVTIQQSHMEGSQR